MDYRRLLYPRAARVVQDASFLRRMFAFLFDLLLLDLVITAPFTPLFEDIVAQAQHGFTTLHYTQQQLVAALFLFLIIYLYFVLFEYILGQTVGMMLLNISVSGEQSLGTLLLRNSFLLPVFPFVLLWIIEPIAILFWRRTLLEYLTRTRTIYQRDILW